MIQYKDFTWEGNDLFLRDRKLATLVPDEKNPDMWRITDYMGDLFSDMYNLDRAKDGIIKHFIFIFNNPPEEDRMLTEEDRALLKNIGESSPEKPAGALKVNQATSVYPHAI